MRCGLFGLIEGKNYPFKKHPNETVLDISGLSDVIIVDRNYFLDHLNEIKSWALEMRKSFK
jgi:hypothetical protein